MVSFLRAPATKLSVHKVYQDFKEAYSDQMDWETRFGDNPGSIIFLGGIWDGVDLSA